ncbi:MAG: response regulator [Actinomycetota bacterium]|nr:response regulator [Actinomycetota bacterium]
MSGTAAGPVRILLVDGYPAHLRRLRAVVQHDAELAVVAEAYSGVEAVMLVHRVRPDLVLMSCDLPDGDALVALETIMADQPTPVVVHSPVLGGHDWTRAVISAGAVDVLPGCAGAPLDDLASYGTRLRHRLLLAARAPVIAHPRARLRADGADGADGAVRMREALVGAQRRPRGALGPIRLLVIGASTGGPAALVSLLGALPVELDVAVLVIQHMAEGFIEGLAEWLDSMVGLPVGVACSGRRLQAGRVALAPSGVNLVIRDDLLVICEPAGPGQYHVPNIDTAFGSVAHRLGPQAVGILLTGMGRDGALGMRALREAGAVTIGQDEATSTVYGMPAAAVAMSAVVEQLPLPAIAPRLVELVAAARRPDPRPVSALEEQPR